MPIVSHRVCSVLLFAVEKTCFQESGDIGMPRCQTQPLHTHTHTLVHIFKHNAWAL